LSVQIAVGHHCQQYVKYQSHGYPADTQTNSSEYTVSWLIVNIKYSPE